MQVIKNELKDIQTRFGDRRTKIIADVDEINVLDLIADEDMASPSRTRATSSARRSTRTARSVAAATARAAATKDDDYVHGSVRRIDARVPVDVHGPGKVYWLRCTRCPRPAAPSRGRSIVNLVQLDQRREGRGCRRGAASSPSQRASASSSRAPARASSRRPTSRSTRTPAPRASSPAASTTATSSSRWPVDGKNDLFLATADGMSIRFTEDRVRPMGRSAFGVIGIIAAQRRRGRLDGGARGTGALLTVTEHGYGKRTHGREYPQHGRAGRRHHHQDHGSQRSGRGSPT